ncbi:MAG: hypothetical protein IPK17_18105, partial [Chloroflexi bacterium]|nr:hypothetical protein [Chloroflexota bacterium]
RAARAVGKSRLPERGQMRAPSRRQKAIKRASCMVTQNYRYTPLAQTVKRVLQSGTWATSVRGERASSKASHFGGFRDEMDYPLIVDMALHHLTCCAIS